MKRFVLIDGHSLLFRAYHALPKTFTNKDGQPINAIYGFMSMLIRVATDLRPDYLVVAFDEKGPTFRHQELVTYKEGRPEMDTEMQAQQPVVRRMLQAFAIPILSIEGYEGEDIIATVITQIKSQISPPKARNGPSDQKVAQSLTEKPKSGSGLEFFIVSGDRDVLQLVDETVRVYSPKKGLSDPVIYDPSNVATVFGVPANRITDYKGLRGDASDRIPGVFGIGEKTAVRLLGEFGSLENLYQNIGRVRSLLGEKVEKKLLEEAEQAVLSKKIATITGAAPLTIALNDCAYHDLKTNLKGLEFLSQLNFKSLLKRLTGEEELKSSKRSRQKEVDENQGTLL